MKQIYEEGLGTYLPCRTHSSRPWIYNSERDRYGHFLGSFSLSTTWNLFFIQKKGKKMKERKKGRNGKKERKRKEEKKEEKETTL